MKSDLLLAMLADANAASGSRRHADVTIDANWISIESMLAPRCETDAVRDLLSHSTWPGGVKWAARQSGSCVRAEIPRHADSATAQAWLRRQVALVNAGFDAALVDAPAAAQTPDDGIVAFDAAMLAERCTAGGWCATIRSDAEVRIEIPARSVHRVASLTPQGDALRIAVDLDTGALAERAPDSHLALALFLRRATNSLQWVRAFAAGSGSTLATTGFECLLAVPGDDRPLIIALDALATACELFGREAEMLAGDAALGSLYLALDRGSAAYHPGRPEIPADSVPPVSVPAPGAVAEAAVA